MVVAASLLASACSDAAKQAARAGASAGPGTVTTVRVNVGWPSWVPYETPLLVADKKGYFAAHHLKVQFIQGSGSQSAVTSVGQGQDQIGWVDLSTAASAIAKNVPVISFATIEPIGSTALVALASSNITKPSDIIGKRIGSTSTGSDSVLLPAFLAANHIAKSQVTIDYLPANAKLSALLSGQVDAISGQGYYDVALLAAQGKQSTQVLYGQYGANVLDHGFVANKSFASANGQVLKDFLAAYKQGYDDTVSDNKTACETFLATGVTGYTNDSCVAQLKGWIPLNSSPSTAGKPFGYNPPDLWQATTQVLETYAKTPAHSPVSDYYTNDYLGQ